MASSNRHWPSMFKSKPCSNTHHHQWQHDINPSLIPSCQRSPFNSGGHEERSPEPKPRWNPKPEQIRILEAIFNSGMVNPPRDEIRKIRAQLQEYGQVGDANVFYWFQNRKSRSKHKQKHLQSSKTVQSHHHHHNIPAITTTTSVSATTTAATSVAASSSTSSSSSEKSSPKKGTDHHHSINSLQMGGVGGGGSSSLSSINVLDVSNSSTTSVNNQNLSFGTSHADLPLFFPFQNNLNFNVFPQNQTLFDPSNVVQVPDHQLLGPCSHGLLLTELLNQEGSKRDHNHQQFSFSTATSATAAAVNAQANIASSATASARFDINSIQGVVAGMSSPAAAGRLTVFINDVAFEVAVGPFNVREAFGDEALLIHSSGQPVLTNEWGVTLQSLQPGAFYYLV